MKYRHKILIILTGSVLMNFSSCINSNKADLNTLISPGELPNLKDSKQIVVSSHDSTGRGKDMISIPAGREATIMHATGPGIINRMWFRVDSKDPYYLRRILIKIYWDKEEEPSVLVPLGDFFGCGFEYIPYTNPYLSMSYGGFTCYFPMPFEDVARIVIVNETGQELKEFYYQISYQKFENALGTETGYFHAYWNRDISTNYDSNYTILKIKGHGHVVGVNLNVQSYDHTFRFLDGDENIQVDGEKNASITGTGTDDWFSSGWHFGKGIFAGTYSGLLLKDDSLGRISAYRYFIMDPIPFKKSINISLEHGFRNMDVADYSSTVFWYQTEETPTKFPGMLKAGLRIPLRAVPAANLIEAEKLTFNVGTIHSRVMDMSDYGAEWGGMNQMLIESGPRENFSVNINHLEETGYDIKIYYTRGPDYGNANIFVGTEKVGQIHGYSPVIQPGGYVSIPEFRNLYNSLNIQFEITGKDSLAKGYFVGLDGFKLEPKRAYIPVWNIIGPFPNKLTAGNSRKRKETAFPPEVTFDSKHEYTGLNGKPVTWHIAKPGNNGFMTLEKVAWLIEPSVYYALIYIYSPEPRISTLMIGSDNAVKVYYNNNKVLTQSGGRYLEPDQWRTFIKINQGWNRLMLKVENKAGQAGFYARILDREHIFRYSPIQDMQTKIPELLPKPSQAR